MDALAEALQGVSLHPGTSTDTSDGPVADFFEVHEFPGYTYDPGQPPEAEFDRLCIARQWGRRRVNTMRTIFHEAVRQEATTPRAGETQQLHHSIANDANSPLQRFFVRNAVNGYIYRGRSPAVEWKRLLRAKSLRFAQCRIEGSEHQALYYRYLEAVEEEVDYLIEQDEDVREGRIKPWEYLCQLFEVGVAPLSKSKARKLLAPIHVNIFDFISYQRAVRAGQRATLQTFPTVRRLAAYSSPARLYPLQVAKADGTLKFLLRSIWRALKE
ncbi:hypothetical protein EV426DRAFT_147464 [Tirmania nivea]|nr:hypothetical protein EV426DRAFT_147464 [Tirmania nivea]